VAALDQLRKLTARKVPGERDAEKATEYRVRLHVMA
jgi:hypothetical protein